MPNQRLIGNDPPLHLLAQHNNKFIYYASAILPAMETKRLVFNQLLHYRFYEESKIQGLPEKMPLATTCGYLTRTCQEASQVYGIRQHKSLIGTTKTLVTDV